MSIPADWWGHAELVSVAVIFIDCTLWSCSDLSPDILHFSHCSSLVKRHCHSQMFLMYVFFLCPCSIKPALTALSSDPSLLWRQQRFQLLLCNNQRSSEFCEYHVVCVTQSVHCCFPFTWNFYCIHIMPLIVNHLQASLNLIDIMFIKSNSLNLFELANVISDMIIYYSGTCLRWSLCIRQPRLENSYHPCSEFCECHVVCVTHAVHSA